MTFQLPQNFDEAQLKEKFVECRELLPERVWEFLTVSLDNPIFSEDIPKTPPPTWVVNLANSFKKTFVLSLSQGSESGDPFETGFFWGTVQSCATLLRERPTLAEPLTEQFNFFFASADAIIKSFVAQALMLPSAEASEFFKGFAEGTSQLDSSGLPAKRNPSFLLHFLLLILRREVEKFESIPALYAWLITVIPPSLTGDIENFQRMCGRIELKLAEQGRPKLIK